MWLREELLSLQVNNLSIRQQLDLLQNNAYIRRNLDSVIDIKLSLNLVVKKEVIGEKVSSRYVREINSAWNNICTYIRLAFPKVWYTIRASEFLCEDTINTKLLFQDQILTNKIHSCKKVIEIFRTIIYGGSLRLPLSQDRQAQKLFLDLLFACQISDISGISSIASQKRIAFLQNWIEKLVFTSSLPSCLLNSAACNSGNITPNSIQKDAAQVTNKKFTVTKLPKSRITSLKNIKDTKTESQSSQSLNTTLSSYIDQQTKPPNFVGIKIKFDSDFLSSGSDTESSVHSIWKPVFKRKRFINNTDFEKE